MDSYIELLQKKIEELESNMLKEKRNSKLNVIHDERIIKQPGSKLIDMDGEQMEG
jgi:hemerythrin superfamily protein